MNLEALSQPDRLAALATLGRRVASGDAEAFVALCALAEDADPWVRAHATQAAAIAGEVDLLVTLRLDPVDAVRRSAWLRLRDVAPDARLAALLREVAHLRWAPTLAVKALRRRGPLPAVEALVCAQTEARTPRWVAALPFCAEVRVAPRLRWMDENGGPEDWRRLAALHPARVAQHLREACGGRKTLDARLSWRIAQLLPTLVHRDPDSALILVEALFVAEGQAQSIRSALQGLAQRRPAATFDLLRARQAMGLPAPLSGLFASVCFTRAERLGRERLLWALRHAPACLPDGAGCRRWFGHLPAADQKAVIEAFVSHGAGGSFAPLFAHVDPGPAREAAYTRWRTAQRDVEGIIQPAALHDLPWDLRQREARYHLVEHPLLASRPTVQRAYCALLGFVEAQTRLTPWLTHPEGDERAAAQRILISTLRHDRAAAPAVLAQVRRRKNEQDPVRLAMLQALAAVVSSRLTPDLHGELAAIIGEAFDAADLSAGTSHATLRLIARLIGAAPALGLSLLDRALQVRGNLDGLRLSVYLGPCDLPALDDALVPAMARFVQRERPIAALTVALGLGPLLRRLPQTLSALEELCDQPHAAVISGVLALLRKMDPPRFRARALALLEADPSVVCLPVVAQLLATVCTDRLDPFLGDRVITGRFSTGRTHWVLDLGLRLEGLHPVQQTRYAASLSRLLADEACPVPEARWAVERLRALRWAPSSSLLSLIDDPRPPVRDLAIRALPGLDPAEALPALLSCLGDDRARIATYALRAVLADMAPDAVFDTLRAVPLGRVTVAKEVLRLMGAHCGLRARDHLIGLAAQELHRDVRIALLRALWEHLEHPGAWAVLEAAARHPDPVLVSRLLAIPTGRLSEDLDHRLCALFAEVLSRKEAEARLGFLGGVAAVPLADRQRVLFGRLLSHLSTPDPAEAALALRAALDRMYPTEVPAMTARLTVALRPRAHALALLGVLDSLHPWSPQHHRELGAALADLLLKDGLTACLGLGLCARVRPVEAVAQALTQLARDKRLHHDLIEAAMGLFVSSPDALSEALAAHPEPRLRRVALAHLVRAAGPNNGWTELRRARLAVFQGDASLEVAAPAAWVLPPHL